jgi:hypothetical protein
LTFVADGVAQLRALDKSKLYKVDCVHIAYDGKSYKLDQFIPVLRDHMTRNETLISTKSKNVQYLTFNRYKASEATLEEIEFLGFLVSYCFYHKIPIMAQGSK